MSVSTGRTAFVSLIVIAAVFAAIVHWVRRSAADEPSSFERAIARRVRNFAIPNKAAKQTNPWKSTSDNVQEAREAFLARCANCHGFDGSGTTQTGRAMYPKPPDLRQDPTQNLTDGQIHYIIANGVRLTGMPAWSPSPDEPSDESWKLVLFIRQLRKPTLAELAVDTRTISSAHYVGSKSCAKCHSEIYERWKKTPMANVVRDPREHPDAITPDLATNKVAKFTKDQVAFVYGSIWKQRYFTKVGDDYFPLSAQWDLVHKKWMPYFVETGKDWWAPFYPPDNMQRPTGPTCDGCHSVGYDIHTKAVAEWNVGCERCHGPGSDHSDHPTRDDILNPAHLD